jgi:hypothetical protein
MARIALPLTLASLALLGACATDYDRGTPVAAAPVVSGSGAVVSSGTVVAPAVVSGQPVLIASTPAPGAVIVPSTAPFKAGMGTVEAVQVVHITSAASASAGSSAPDRLAYRLTLKMDDGSLQAVDQDNRNFAVGDRVEIASNGVVVRR